ncbi:D-2-hydroxyacid dehydrogenase [Halosimplex pelagicum]|uniref:D-2-hydroxyacid dehydrogenase n=1 Tax=Halosimplex pelagicum TaxID=869886 RepID=A0A7D5T7D9_9EURY|nr:D-2-hydroxyacid dehydrogenase [Halosimplex pelagicum]QLH84651.1 D-2-hydroxyacid dehydrogenase [Halosimplex pelagicum]
MRLDRIGVDESVAAVFPPGRLVDRLGDATDESGVDVTAVDGSPEGMADCDAVVTLEHHEAYLDLSWVHSIQAGVDRFPRDRLREAGVALTNSTGIHGDAVGETVAGFVLALARRIHEYAASQTANEWNRPDWDEAWTVAGERACVIGLGGLGRGIVGRLTGLGLDVDGVRRDPLPEPGVDRVYPTGDLREAVGDARFVVLAVPLTDATRGLVGRDELAAMDDDAYLINVARGGVVDQSALVAALRDDEIAGAALDVFETEPLPADSPLWDFEDVIVSPHCAAYTRDYYRHVATVLEESVRRVGDGEDPVNRVV